MLTHSPFGHIPSRLHSFTSTSMQQIAKDGGFKWRRGREGEVYYRSTSDHQAQVRIQYYSDTCTNRACSSKTRSGRDSGHTRQCLKQMLNVTSFKLFIGTVKSVTHLCIVDHFRPPCTHGRRCNETFRHPEHTCHAHTTDP